MSIYEVLSCCLCRPQRPRPHQEPEAAAATTPMLVLPTIAEASSVPDLDKTPSSPTLLEDLAWDLAEDDDQVNSDSHDTLEIAAVDNAADIASPEQSRAARMEMLMEHFENLMAQGPAQGPAPPEALQQLRSVVFDPDVAASLRQDAQCIICLSPFETGEELEQLPGCHHLYHPDCISKWLERTSSCPICRHDIRPSIGAVVRLVDLANASHLNGATGICLQRLESCGSWLVRLASGEEKSIRPQEMEVTHSLRSGTVVRICGLANASHLNGTEATCTEFQGDSSPPRWRVRLASGEYHRIKPENLEVVCQPDGPLQGGEGNFAGYMVGAMQGVQQLSRDPLFQQEGIQAIAHVLSEPSGQQQVAEEMQQAGMDPLLIENMLQLLRGPQAQQIMQQGMATMQHLSNNPSGMQQLMQVMSHPQGQTMVAQGLQRAMSNPAAMSQMQQAMSNPEAMSQMQNAMGHMMGGPGFH